jgi:hypothetical protein
MYTTSVSPAKTLSNALSAVNTTLAGYNSRLG